MSLLIWAGCTGECKDCLPGETGEGDTAAEDSGSGDSGSDSGDSQDTSPEDTGDTGSPPLNGTPPEADVPAPTFEVMNRDGTVRTRDDLLGHPTVVWFYPAANTGG